MLSCYTCLEGLLVPAVVKHQRCSRHQVPVIIEGLYHIIRIASGKSFKVLMGIVGR